MSMYWEDFEVGRRYETYGRTVTEGDLSLFCAFVEIRLELLWDRPGSNTRFSCCQTGLCISLGQELLLLSVLLLQLRQLPGCCS